MFKIDDRQLELIAAHEWYGPHLAWNGCTHKVLKGVKPKRANLRGAYLRDANLQSAILIGADLQDAKLQDADLEGADLTGAKIDFASLPLSCGSLNFKDDSGEIVRQIAYHSVSLKLANGFSVSEEELEFANSWEGVERWGLPLLKGDEDGTN